jgi:hypothetical protein
LQRGITVAAAVAVAERNREEQVGLGLEIVGDIYIYILGWDWGFIMGLQAQFFMDMFKILYRIYLLKFRIFNII